MGCEWRIWEAMTSGSKREGGKRRERKKASKGCADEQAPQETPGTVRGPTKWQCRMCLELSHYGQTRVFLLHPPSLIG